MLGLCTDMKDLKTILRGALPRPNMATSPESASQTDPRRGKHPKSVRMWDGFGEAVRSHRDGKDLTERRFVSNREPDPVCLLPLHLPL